MIDFLFSKEKEYLNFKSKEFKVTVPAAFKEKVTCLGGFTNANIVVGREDGKMQIANVDKNRMGTVEIFRKEYDLLDNENIKESITAMVSVEENNLSKTLFVANEKNIKCVELREKMSVVDLIKHNKVEPKIESFTPKKHKIFYKQNETENEVFVGLEYTSNTKVAVNNVHKYLINSLTLNISNEILISADLLNINLWKPERMEKTYTVVDIKEKLDLGSIFVINTTKFSKSNDSLFGYCTSQGQLCIHDIKVHPKESEVHKLDVSAPCKKSLNLNASEDQGMNVIKSISDFVFVDEYLIATRTLDRISVFDVRNSSGKLFDCGLFKVTDEIVNSELIYEKFKICHSENSLYTGTLDGQINVFNTVDEKLKKIKVKGIDRGMCAENGIKHVSVQENILTCANNNRIVNYYLNK